MWVIWRNTEKKSFSADILRQQNSKPFNMSTYFLWKCQWAFSPSHTHRKIMITFFRKSQTRFGNKWFLLFFFVEILFFEFVLHRTVHCLKLFAVLLFNCISAMQTFAKAVWSVWQTTFAFFTLTHNFVIKYTLPFMCCLSQS